MKALQRVLLIAVVATVAVAAQVPIHIAFHWHLHQPIYYPYENVVQTIQASRFNYSVLDIFNQRTGPYLGWPLDSVSAALSGGLKHCGAQISFSGALQENLLNLGNSAIAPEYKNFQQRWQQAQQSLRTAAGNPAAYLTAFGYHHPLMPLTEPFFVTLQIQLHRLMQSQTLGVPLSSFSAGLFPPENAFSERMIPALLEAGIEWVLVDNIHFDRAHVNYTYSPGENIYPPNPADQLNTHNTSWLQLKNLWAPSQVSAPFGYRPYWVQYIDPETGAVSKIIAVPGARYEGVEDGRGGFGALQYEQVMSQYASVNTDPTRPMLVVMAHDGDNYGGGTDSYYHGNFNNFVSWAQSKHGSFECYTVEDYLQQYPIPEDEVIHVEEGSWSGANNGDPQFLKWNPNFFTSSYEPERNSWAVLTATSNRLLTAQQIAPYQSVDNVLSGSGSLTEQALHYFLCGQASDYEYWPTELVWNSDPTVAANLAVKYADQVIATGVDKTSPSIFPPQRQYWNPGAPNWNPKQPDPSDFSIFTLVYDVSGLADVQIHLRISPGQLAPSEANLLYSGGSWKSLSMTEVPPTGPLAPQTNPLPTYIASLFTANVTGVTHSLIDYYVSATDKLGNVAKSAIFHVYVAGN